MHIGGFQRNSLIDFPETIAAVVFTPGCNFICPYCHNPELASGKGDGQTWSQEEVFSFLERRKGLLQGVVISGGEPTLQGDLVAFCQALRDMGYQIKLDSNGSHPRVLSELFGKGLVDYLAMDIKTDPAHYPMLMKTSETLQAVRESVSLIMEKAPAYEFRTTCVRPFVSDEVMHGIGAWIRGAKTYILQPCSRRVDVLDPEFMAGENRFFTPEGMTALKEAVVPYVENVRIR